MGSYLKLGLATLFPCILAVTLFLLDKKTVFGRLSRKWKQLICGVLFGGLAVIGTEWGIPINGAQVNCRDGAVLTAGLLFGAPAGILAGLIGGAERWIAVAWGVGTFTRTACTVSTILAGFYAALLRKYMFEDKRPGWLLSAAVGVVMEVVHLTMVFVTNMATPTEAMAVVRSCTAPMIIANALGVMLATIGVSLAAHEDISLRHGETKSSISQTVQRWLLVTVLLAFAATSYFVFQLQDSIALRQTETLLTLSNNEVSADIKDASDANLLQIAHAAANDMLYMDPDTLIERYDLAEVNVVNSGGIIVSSNVPEYVGYNMYSGKQSAEFTCLLGDTEEFVQDYGDITFRSGVQRKYAGVKFSTGFIQVGYDADQFQSAIDDEVVGITKNRHVGESGLVLILDADYTVVSAPDHFPSEIFSHSARLKMSPEPETVFRTNLLGTVCYCRYCETENYYILSMLPETEALQMRNVALYVNTFLEIMVFAVLFGLIYLLIKRVVVDRIKTVNRSLAKIAGGDLNETVTVRTNTEFVSLSDDINSTVRTLKRYIDEASARIDQELEFAKNIQSSALPSVFPAFPKRKEFDIFALMDPAKEVGGDFYDFYFSNTDTLNFLVADVSGKGIPAAMFMMRAKTQLKSLTEAELPLNEVFTRGNAALCEGNDAGMFVTAWEGSIDLTSGHVNFANAGHNPPLVRRGNGTFEYLKTRAGFVLAGMEGLRYKAQELDLEPGDVIFLYTDGVTEATNKDNELYGETRLRNVLNSREFWNMQEMCKIVKSDVDKFVGDAPQFDDITMVALKYLGEPPVPTIHFDTASLEDIPAVTEFIETELEKLDCPMKTIVQINIAIDEIYSNIVKYAYPDQPGPATVKLVYYDDPAAVYVRFSDEGIPYNPLTKADPDITLSAEERKIGGLGIFMVKKTMDDIRYKYEDGQNVLTICKKLG